MKKALKIIGTTLLIIIALLVAIPFAFQGKIKDMAKQIINQNLNAQVEFSDVSLSFIRSFPQAHVTVTDLVITNFEPFKDETFTTAKDIAFTMSVKELFKSATEEPIVINTITINEALLTLKTDKFGNNNYDITKKDTNSASAEGESSSFSFDIEDYTIKNSVISYIDEGSNIIMHITEFNHEGHGIFSADNSELITTSEANVSFLMDSTSYLSNNPVKLDAVIGLDLNNNMYTFKENKGFINDLPIEFKGYVKLLENGQELDVTFENPESDFKNFLAVIPKTYSKSMGNVQTTGDFKVKGHIKGINSDETIPNLDISITSNNASFKYPNLPKRVENIIINTEIKNTTGYIDDTFIDIKTLNFKIDDDVFKSSASLKNITKNMLVNANLDGTLNLSNLTKAYPIKLENALTGILKATLTTSFDINALKTNAYQRIKSKGIASISDFVFSSEDIVNPIHISQTDMTFNSGTVALNNFKAQTGESDLNATGTITNLLGFLLSDNTLKGNFNVSSNIFKVSDFMTEDAASKENKTTSASESLKIPSFLDCTINAIAKTVIYDNLSLKNVTGKLLIKDQQATLEDMKSTIFNGALSISGNVSTKSDTPDFNLSLGADGFDIAESFKNLELLKNLAPIAKLLDGKLNAVLNFSGKLDKEFSPELNTISGKALAELLTARVKTNEDLLINKLEGALGFIDFDKLDLKDIKTQLIFANGKVSVKPFNLKYKDIAITVSGAHGFDKTLSYSAVFNVPAKYLGSEINRLIEQINTPEINNVTIPVTATIGGTFNNPIVKTDLTNGISTLTKQLIEIEKQKVLNQGKDKVKDLIGDVLGSNKQKTDSVKQKQSEAIKDVLGDIVSGNKTKDSTSTSVTKDVVKDVLGGLLGGKKKTIDTVK